MTLNSSNYLEISKTWQDSVQPFFSIRVKAISPFAEVVHDGSYTSLKSFQDNMHLLHDCMDNYPSETCVMLTMLGHHPGVVIRLIPRDTLGHMYIEVDLSIMDIDDGSHRAKFFVESELGQIERFFKRLGDLPNKDIGHSVKLHESV